MAQNTAHTVKHPMCCWRTLPTLSRVFHRWQPGHAGQQRCPIGQGSHFPCLYVIFFGGMQLKSIALVYFSFQRFFFLASLSNFKYYMLLLLSVLSPHSFFCTGVCKVSLVLRFKVFTLFGKILETFSKKCFWANIYVLLVDSIELTLNDLKLSPSLLNLHSFFKNFPFYFILVFILLLCRKNIF